MGVRFVAVEQVMAITPEGTAPLYVNPTHVVSFGPHPSAGDGYSEVDLVGWDTFVTVKHTPEELYVWFQADDIGAL